MNADQRERMRRRSYASAGKTQRRPPRSAAATTAGRGRDSGFGVGDELVAEATDGDQVARFGGVGLDVAAEADYEIVDGAGVGVFAEVPDVVENGFAGYGFAGAADQVTEEFGFH